MHTKYVQNQAFMWALRRKDPYQKYDEVNKNINDGRNNN